MLVCIYVCECMCTYEHVCGNVCLCMCICEHVCDCVHVCLHVYVCVCVSMYVCVHVNVWCVYTCVYAWLTPCVLSGYGRCHILLAATGHKGSPSLAVGMEGGEADSGSEERRAFLTERTGRAETAQQPWVMACVVFRPVAVN